MSIRALSFIETHFSETNVLKSEAQVGLFNSPAMSTRIIDTTPNFSASLVCV